MTVDDWIAGKIGLGAGAKLTRDALEAYQLSRLLHTLRYAAAHSAFYRERLSGFDFETDSRAVGKVGCAIGTQVAGMRSLADLARISFTTPRDLAEEGVRMVCVPASQVDRIVTLPTSGTTGAPKRVWFTAADQELMVDYIHHGLPVMTGPGDVFIVLMPCARPGSVGDLVAAGVERIGSRAVRVGAIPQDGSRDEEVLAAMRREGVTTGLATAPTAARLARKSAGDKAIAANMRSVLLSAQFISDEDRDAVERIWDCKTFEHYGMTEMGLGGAMACGARVGYHPREADLLFEIIDPVTGDVLPDGEDGEVVFTTLTRTAMPLIRYRTGDLSRWLPDPCPCGSVLRRLGKIGDRMERKAY